MSEDATVTLARYERQIDDLRTELVQSRRRIHHLEAVAEAAARIDRNVRLLHTPGTTSSYVYTVHLDDMKALERALSRSVGAPEIHEPLAEEWLDKYGL